MNIITLSNRHEHPVESTWAHVEPGDLLCYADGTSFYVESYGIRESDYVTLYTRCVVGPPDGEPIQWSFGDPALLSVNIRQQLPEGMMITKG